MFILTESAKVLTSFGQDLKINCRGVTAVAFDLLHRMCMGPCPLGCRRDKEDTRNAVVLVS